MTAITTQTRFRVEGMDCAACATKIDTVVRKMPGVADVSVSVTAGTMTLHHDATSDLVSIAKKVSGLGYALTPLAGQAPNANENAHTHDHAGHYDGGHDHSSASRPWWKSKKGLLTIASGAALVAAYGAGKAVPSIAQWVFVAAMLIGLIPIGRRAIMAAIAGSPFTIEMLMTIAAGGAVIIGAGEEGATVVFLFLVGELLEGVAAGKARASIQGLTKLVPRTALIERNGQTQEVAADAVAVGAIVLVRPGERIPADGVIVSGESAIDEALMTGESKPVRKGVDANVFAGTINSDAVLRIRVTAAAADNTIARVVKLVEEAQESKAPTERFIDRFSRWYTPGVTVVAFLVAIIPPLAFGEAWGAWVYKGLAILLIGCPCALVISTPAAIAASLSSGARLGLLLKGGAVLEQLGKITAVCFDKTGTLTEGKPQVTDVVAFGRNERDVLSMAAALETGSTHPLAVSVLKRAKADKVPVPPAGEASALSGKGVVGRVGGVNLFLGSAAAAGERVALTPEQTARIEALNGVGKTVSVLLAGNIVAGAIAMRDEPRADALAGLKTLTDAGIKVIMLTGDNRRAAEAIGKQLGIEVRAELMPQDKQRIVDDLKHQGLIVAKVGDGINDAPALAAAHVGIAMGGCTDVALETADAAVLHGRVADVAAMIALSNRTMGNIHQNITMALGLKAVFLVTTVIGITGLWPAILADTGATVLVTLNAMRLLRPV
ncbi:heavy metal translocating P-type ATPase [Lichenihabitans psoromatis]|uniref:heavy metal translocating P-type ATPase n=1 Tax=Lichenihabitans psoromatis TaxID=2528642 RepID=UPI0010367930|nr:heavy metal translocating P-type ATPase [Lichenihabitans psoromatis]